MCVCVVCGGSAMLSTSTTNIWPPKKPHIMTDLSNKTCTHKKINDGNKCTVKRLSMATKIVNLNQTREDILSSFYSAEFEMPKKS